MCISVRTYSTATNYSTTLSKIEGWLWWPNVCIQANSAPVYILTWKFCSTHQYAAIRLILCHFICILQRKPFKCWWSTIDKIEYFAVLPLTTRELGHRRVQLVKQRCLASKHSNTFQYSKLCRVAMRYPMLDPKAGLRSPYSCQH